MASRSYERAASFAKKATKPPAKTVVFSLVAFLIVAAAPWLIIQTESVVEDGSVSNILIEDDDVSVYTMLTGSNMSTAVSTDLFSYTQISLDEDNSFFFVFDVDDSISSIHSVVYSVAIPIDDLRDQGFFKIRVASEDGLIAGVQCGLLGASFKNFEKVSDDVFEMEYSELDLALMSISDYDHPEFYFKFFYVEDQVPDVMDFNLEYFSHEDDYSGTVIAFAAGVFLIVLAVLSTNFINPTKWGKRRK